MLSLDDEEDLIAVRPIGSVEPERRRFSLRPVLMGLLVLVLGGALGGGAYLVSSMDTRDLIGLLDIGDQPHLSLEMPKLGGGPAQPATPAPAPAAANGGLLTPPGAPTLTPPPPLPPLLAPKAAEGEAAGVAAMPMTPPLKPEPAKPELAPAPVAAAPPAPAAAVAGPAAMPEAPAPRNPDQPPTYASLPNRLTDPKPLPPAPIEGLTRQSAYGVLPVVGKDGTAPWRAYGRPFTGGQTKPKVAVVVVNLGLDKDATEAAITKLPAEVTLAFSPYAGTLDKWVKKARDFGHEVVLMLPAEPEGFPARDPGPLGLLAANPPEENIARMEKVLARGIGAVGVLAPDGNFVRSPKLSPVLDALRSRGLIYLGSNGGQVEVASAPVTAHLEQDLFRDAIEARLGTAAAAAKTAGSGLVLVSPRPVAFDRLVGWLDKLPDQGLVLAPATAIVKQPGKS